MGYDVQKGSDKTITNFSIVTAAAAPSTSRYHDRIPLVLEQRCKVIVRNTTMEADVRLNCLASSWIRGSSLSNSSPRRSTARGDSSRSLGLITSGTPGLLPGLALRPGSQSP